MDAALESLLEWKQRKENFRRKTELVWAQENQVPKKKEKKCRGKKAVRLKGQQASRQWQAFRAFV